MSPGEPSEHDSRVGLVTEELRRLVAAGAAVDVRALARRFGLPWTDVERCAKAVRAMHAAAPEPATETPEELPLPPLPEDYEVLGELGRGGMAVVYRARQKSLGRVVAVKVLRPGDLVFGAMQKRFLREARALARLRHPHIVSVHEVGQAGGHVFFSMDLVNGESLAELVQRGEMTPTRAVKLLRQVASAITYSHANGLVHRDLKPGNILVDRAGDAFVVDFGLARDMAGKADLTGTGQLLGTPAYMSPEQARGDAALIGEATDVYALGAVLYECLTGRQPFTGASLVNTIRAVVHDEPVAPRKLDRKIPPDLEVICLKAMAKEPERRYANAQALLEDLERFAEGREIRARPPSRVHRLRKLVARHRTAALAIAATGAVAAAVLWIVLAINRAHPERDWLATAREALAAKDPTYAAKVCDDALRRYADGVELWRDRGDGDEESVAMELVGCALEAHTGRIRGLYEAGRFREAADAVPQVLDPMIGRVFQQLQRIGRDGFSSPGYEAYAPELRWLAVRANARLGDVEGVRVALIPIADKLPMRAEELVRDEDGCLTYRGLRLCTDDFVPFLDRLEALLAGADAGERLAATIVLGEALASSGTEAAAHDWLRRHPRTGVDAAAAVLRELPRWTPVGRDIALAGAVARALEDLAVVRPRETTAALATLAGDASAAAAPRAVAAEVLRVVDDLPLPATEPQARRVDRILALHASISGPADASLRSRIDVASGEGAPSAWLAEHTGLSDFAAGWSVQQTLAPHVWFARALALPEKTSRAELLRLLLTGADPPGSLRRAWLHEWLRLEAPETVAAPAWGHGLAGPGGIGVREPEGLAAAWRDALPGDATADRFRVRIATLVFFEGRDEPLVLGQEAAPLRVGESTTLASQGTLGVVPVVAPEETTHWFHFPWPDGAPFDVGAWPSAIDRRFEMSLAYGPAGVAFSWSPRKYVDWYIGRTSWTGASEDRAEVNAGPVLARGDVKRCWMTQRGLSTDERALRVITVGAFEPESADASDWTWPRWRDALAGSPAAEHVKPLPPRGDHPGLGLVAFALVAAAAGLAAFRVARPRSVPAGRWRAACALVVLGLAVAANHCVVRGVDLHGEWVGFLLTAIGMIVLARAAEGWRRRVAIGGAVLLVFASSMPFLGFEFVGLGSRAPLLLLLGFPSILWLAAALERPRWPLGRLYLLALWPVAPVALALIHDLDRDRRLFGWGALVWLGLVLASLVVAVRRRSNGELTVGS